MNTHLSQAVFKYPQERVTSRFIPLCENASEPQGQNLSNQSVYLLGHSHTYQETLTLPVYSLGFGPR